MYPTILKPDPIAKYPKLYRSLRIKGYSVKLKQMAKDYKDRDDIEYVGLVKGYKIFKFNELHEYKPKASVESWTTTLGNAVNFVKAWNMEAMHKDDYQQSRIKSHVYLRSRSTRGTKIV